MAARLGLSINDPEETISCKARACMYLLAQILLHQRGKETQLEYKAPMPAVSLQKPGPRCWARRFVSICPFPTWEQLRVSALMIWASSPQRRAVVLQPVLMHPSWVSHAGTREPIPRPPAQTGPRTRGVH